MTQGGRGPSSLLRLSSIPPAASPSAERVRAVAASKELGVRLLKKLSQRPLMSVWEAEDGEGKPVALTVIDANGTPSERARVLRAARALATLQSPGLLRVRAVSDEAHAFVSDLWTTGTLSDLPVLRWPMQRKLDFLRRVATALAALHEAKIVHGCLCPDNVLLDDDFGPVVTEAQMVSIAESLEGDKESFFGYGAYAAPEASGAGVLDARADVYSLGRLATFLALDREPTASDQGELAQKAPEVLPLVQRATRPAPGDRYPTMADLAADLERGARQASPEDAPAVAAARRSRVTTSPMVPSMPGPSAGAADRRSTQTAPGAPSAATTPDPGRAAGDGKRSGTSDSGRPAADAPAPRRTGTVPTPAAMPVRRPEPASGSPASGKKRARRGEPIVIELSMRWAMIGLGGLAACCAVSYSLVAMSTLVERLLTGGAAVSAAVAIASVPLRQGIRLGLAAAVAAIVLFVGPAGRLVGHGKLGALRSESPQERAVAARALVSSGIKTLAHARIAGADLSRLDLSNADLAQADLTGANLKAARFGAAKLDGAVLARAALQGVDLTQASVEGLDLESAECDAETRLPAGWRCDARTGLVVRAP